jgi:hypothetical protein
VDNKSLDYKYKIIFKFKRNEEKLIDSWNMKIEKNWGKNNWEDLLFNSRKN